MRPLHPSRRTVCGAGLALVATAGRAARPPDDVSSIEDFDELWRTLKERYCYMGEKSTDWNKVRSLYRPMVTNARTMTAFTDIVRRVLSELYDGHTYLSDPPAGSPRSPPFDLIAERAGGAVRIAAVQDGSAAADAGLKVGDGILTVDGRPVEMVVRELRPMCLTRPDPAADAFAINAAVAGRTGRARRLLVSSAGAAGRPVVLPVTKRPTLPDVEGRRLPDGIGCIVIRSFADAAVVDAFDEALMRLRDAPGLVIDVRNNGGGDTAVARPIMGRFIAVRAAYALMRRRKGSGLSPPWTEYVDPRGPFTYSQPVVVLTGHWSANMAEGFPMGMRDIGRAIIVGTRMMGLSASVFPIRLDRTGIDAQYSGEPVYDTQDRPRQDLRPDVEVSPGEDSLPVGMAVLRTAIDQAGRRALQRN